LDGDRLVCADRHFADANAASWIASDFHTCQIRVGVTRLSAPVE
jgi:hypothetical protein